jgi:hypothetical protein
MLAERIYDKLVRLIDNLIWDAVPPYSYDPDYETRNRTKAVVDVFSNQITRPAVVDAIEDVMFLTHQQRTGMAVTVAPGWNPMFFTTLATLGEFVAPPTHRVQS